MMEEMNVRDVSIPHTTNVTSNNQKPAPGGRLKLKKNIVQLLHKNGQFTGLSHENPRVHIQNFPEINDIYRLAVVNSN